MNTEKEIISKINDKLNNGNNVYLTYNKNVDFHTIVKYTNYFKKLFPKTYIDRYIKFKIMKTKKFYTVAEISNMMEILKEQEEQLAKPTELDWLRKRLENAHQELWDTIQFINAHTPEDKIVKIIAYRLGCGGGDKKIYIDMNINNDVDNEELEGPTYKVEVK